MIKYSHVYAQKEDYTFKQSEFRITSSLCNYKRIRLHSKCKDFFFFPHNPFSIMLPQYCMPLSYHWLFHLANKQQGVKEGKLPKEWDRILRFKSSELPGVKVITSCRQWEERHGELISLAKRKGLCVDPLWFPAPTPPAGKIHNQQRH